MTSEATALAADLPSIDALLARAGHRRTGDPTRIAAGTLNRNYRVPTEAGPAFARCCRSDLDETGLGREHSITAWAAERGIPAVVPLTLEDGATATLLDCERWALFPWIDGRNPDRGAITSAEAASMGAMHGQIQFVLAGHPESTGQTLADLRDRLAWDTRTSIEKLQQLETVARDREAGDELLAALTFQRALLEGGDARPFAEYAWLPAQLLHGDFHDQQILLDAAGSIVGVVDWELTKVAGRVWELIRALSFSQLLETELAGTYLRAYVGHVALTEAELRAGLDLWWQTRLHTTWVYEAVLLEGNDRVAPFLAPTDQHLRRSADPGERARLADRLVAAAGL